MVRKSKRAINQYRGAFFLPSCRLLKWAWENLVENPIETFCWNWTKHQVFKHSNCFHNARTRPHDRRLRGGFPDAGQPTCDGSTHQLAITFTRSWETNQIFWPVKATEAGPQSSRLIAFKVAVFYLSVLLSILHKLKLEFFLSFLTSSFVIVKRIV